MTNKFRHFLNLNELKSSQVKSILKKSHQLKKDYRKIKFSKKKNISNDL